MLVDSGVTLNTGNMDIADHTSGASGMVTVTGTNSKINQVLAGATLTVGSTSGGAGSIDINGDGTFTTGTGTTTIDATGTVNVGAIGGGTFNVNGPVTVNGAGSTLTQNVGTALTVGHASTGTATINVTDRGVFTTGMGLTTLKTTGTLNVNTSGTFNALGDIDLAVTINLVGGTLSAVDINFTGSSFNFPFGTLELNSNQSLDATRLADFDVATLTGGKTFRVNGSTTLLAPMTLLGGTFSMQSLVNPAVLDFQTGTFELTGDNLVIGPAGLFGAPLTLAVGQTIGVTNTATVEVGETLLIENGGSLDAGTLENGGSVVLPGLPRRWAAQR